MSDLELTTGALTHADLVKRACRWLKNSRHCSVVLAGLVAAYCSEIPDAIGWRASGESTLIEVKVSRSDFRRDRHKVRARCPELSMGCYRYYMTPRGLLRLDEVPGVSPAAADLARHYSREDEKGVDMSYPTAQGEERRTAILAFIRKTIETTGHKPTMRQIGQAVGLRSTCSVQKHMDILIDRGEIFRTPFSWDYTLRDLNAPKICPNCRQLIKALAQRGGE